MGEPADCVAFTTTSRMFNQVVMTDTFLLGRLDQTANRLKLVVAGKDEDFFFEFAAIVIVFFVYLQVKEASEQIQ